MESYNDVFKAVKRYCADRMVEASYNLFIRPLEAGTMGGTLLEGGHAATAVTIIAPNRWNKSVVEDRFVRLISEGFENILGFTVIIRIDVKEPDAPTGMDLVRSGNYAFTFDTFIVGSSNKFAHAAALAVAQNPAGSYNPLFIYGDSGLGKTHLLHAIKTEIQKNHPDYNIVYVDGETFTTEIISAIRDNKTAEFQNKYRKSDVLLVDDIQFIAGKTSTQEEFFHTFNALHNAGKQIVLVSDRSPKEIKSLEERLRTRFEWGLMADIQAPDFETRCAIINRKAEAMGLDLKRDVIDFIAGKVQTNIRQLEGVVKKMNALKEIEGKAPVIATAQMAIKDIMSEQISTPMTVEKIMEETAKVYNCAVSDLKGKSHKQDVSEARKMAMYIIKDVCGLTMKEIGNEFGGRDHATVVYSVGSVEKKMKTDSFYRSTVDDIIKNVKTL